MYDHGGGVTSVFVPLPSSFPPDHQTQRHRRGKGKHQASSAGMHVNLVLDPRKLLPPHSQRKKQRRKGRNRRRQKRAERDEARGHRSRGQDADIWSSRSSDSSTDSDSSSDDDVPRTDLSRGPRDAGIDYIGRRFRFDVARKEMKKRVWHDGILSVGWLAGFGLAVGWGGSCSPGGFQGWWYVLKSPFRSSPVELFDTPRLYTVSVGLIKELCELNAHSSICPILPLSMRALSSCSLSDVYNSILSTGCLLAVCFSCSFVFGMMDLRIKLPLYGA